METCSDKRKALAPILQRGQNYTNFFRVSIVQGHSITSDSTLVSVNRSFICKSNILITHNSLNLSFISSRFFIEKKGDDAKKVIISRGHIKLRVPTPELVDKPFLGVFTKATEIFVLNMNFK